LSIAGNRRSDVAIASERSVDQIYSQFEHWLGERLGKRIADGKPLTSSDKGGEALTINTMDWAAAGLADTSLS
jgi:hypothetical protein